MYFLELESCSLYVASSMIVIPPLALAESFKWDDEWDEEKKEARSFPLVHTPYIILPQTGRCHVIVSVRPRQFSPSQEGRHYYIQTGHFPFLTSLRPSSASFSISSNTENIQLLAALWSTEPHITSVPWELSSSSAISIVIVDGTYL